MKQHKKGGRGQTHPSDKEFEKNAGRLTNPRGKSTEDQNIVGNNSLDSVTNDSSGLGRGWFGTRPNSQDRQPENKPERPASSQKRQNPGKRNV